MKRVYTILFIFNILFINLLYVSPTMAITSNIEFTKEETDFIKAHENETLLIGLDSHASMGYFEYRGKKSGFLLDVISLIEKETKIRLKIDSEKSWSEALNALPLREIDILFGANPTALRKEYMSFTRPIIKYPYAALAKKNSTIQTIGDLDNKKVAFIDGDVSIQIFLDTYKNIDPLIRIYSNQEEALVALSNNEVDGFIVYGGAIINEFIFNHSDIKYIAEINTITSDMTLSVLKEKTVLASILDKVIAKYLDTEIKTALQKAEILYTRKILNLTPSELDWLEKNNTVVVGVADDYLPFDYYAQGEYKGVAGSVFNEIARLLGIKSKAVYGSFSDIYNKALEREIDVVNMAKTPERSNFFYFPQPFSYERDQIYGRRESKLVQDIYGLEGKSVAVIDGFWQEEYLLKNLKKVDIIKTLNIEEALEKVNKKEADYFIENPTVADFYIQGLGYNNIILKGVTSSDSFLYFGVSKNKHELYSIMDKAISLISYQELKYNGLSDLPTLVPVKYERLNLIIIVLITGLFLIAMFTFKILKNLADEKAKILLLSERTKLLYTDSLTGLNNRNSFKHMEEEFDNMAFPQIIIMADMNNLKNTNDQYGHHMGDMLIQKCSDILDEVFKGCKIFRMGGDEFLILCPNEETEHIEAKIESVNEIAAKAIITDGEILIDGLCVAMGAAKRQSVEDDFNKKMIEADNSMYIHKKQLKNLNC